MTQNGISRRGFLQATGAAATAAGLSQLASPRASEAAALSSQPFQPRGKLTQQPNFLYIMADEYRFPVPYESPELAEFRAQNLTAEQFFRQNGLEFTNHYIMSAACVPSRASIFTGQYPSLHGVSQTTGAAKSSFEQDMFWLDPGTVPTMGSYFRAGGYDTYYKGKWHFSEADILIPGTHTGLLSFREDVSTPGRDRGVQRDPGSPGAGQPRQQHGAQRPLHGGVTGTAPSLPMRGEAAHAKQRARSRTTRVLTGWPGVCVGAPSRAKPD
jgi:choline-sulfatase